MNFDDAGVFLPKHLSPEDRKELFRQMKGFPYEDGGRIFTSRLADTQKVYQGDGLRDLLLISLPRPEIKSANCMVLSNTCDIDLDNERKFGAIALCYAPIFNLEKYESMLSDLAKVENISVEEHLRSLRQQLLTNALYLPAHGALDYDGVVFFDRVCHVDNEFVDRTKLAGQRLFSLGDYGAYLLAMKLSIHFTRLTDGVSRGQR